MGGQTAGPELTPDAFGQGGVGNGVVPQGEGDAQRFVLGGAQFVEGQDVHAVDVPEAGEEAGESVDGLGIVGPAGDEDVADPYRDAETVQPGGEVERGGEFATGERR